MKKNRFIVLLSTLSVFSQLANAEIAPQSTTHLDEGYSEKDSYSRQWGLTVGLNLLSVDGLELHYRPDPRFSISANIGAFSANGDSSTSSSYSSSSYSSKSTGKLSLFETDFRAKWHPFGRSFFLGTAIGYQSIEVGSFFDKVSYDGFFISPHLGWLWIMDDGLALGFEAGPSFALSNTVSLTAGKRTLATGSTSYALPLITLFKIGYMF